MSCDKEKCDGGCTPSIYAPNCWDKVNPIDGNRSSNPKAEKHWEERDRVLTSEVEKIRKPLEHKHIEGRAVSYEEKKAVMGRILAAWSRHPEQRLGQFLVNTIASAKGAGFNVGSDIFYLEDKDLADRALRYESK